MIPDANSLARKPAKSRGRHATAMRGWHFRRSSMCLIWFRGHFPKGGHDVTMADTTRAKRARRRFSEEFKAQTVRLVIDEGKSVTAVARELDLVPSAVGVWVKHALADRTKGKTGLTTAEREELVRLRRELRIAQEERDILKKATAFFAKQSR